MRKVSWALTVVSILLVILSLVWYHWWYPKEYAYALQLADDASLPEQKAEYLKEYLKVTSNINGPPRYIFMRPDLELSKQRVIMGGLINRFEEISRMKQGEMAYQQGMYQLTGQEIDHQLTRVSGIFRSAKLRDSVFSFFVFGIGWMFMGTLSVVAWIITLLIES